MKRSSLRNSSVDAIFGMKRNSTPASSAAVTSSFQNWVETALIRKYGTRPDAKSASTQTASCSRASALRSTAMASSRSRMTPWTGRSHALCNLRASPQGTYRSEDISLASYLPSIRKMPSVPVVVIDLKHVRNVVEGAQPQRVGGRSNVGRDGTLGLHQGRGLD